MMALSAVIFVIVYGRMIEIYMVTSLAPIPFATFGNREQSHDEYDIPEEDEYEEDETDSAEGEDDYPESFSPDGEK